MDNYQNKKDFYSGVITVIGRKPVLEVLADEQLQIHRLHLADSNKPGGIIGDIVARAETRGVEILYHDRLALSRISRNAKQDQGVAMDILCPQMQKFEQGIFQSSAAGDRQCKRWLALDGVTNPQNLGMIIRSACAGWIDGILIPDKNSAGLNALTIKASAGTVFRAPIIRCDSLAPALQRLAESGWLVAALSSHAKESLLEFQAQSDIVYVLGNETHGVSDEVSALANCALKIPMNNGVESLNVAVTAALIAFHR